MSVVFSEFEIESMGLKFAGDPTYSIMDCIGSAEEELTTKTITKKSRGTVVKTVVKGTGEGSIKVSAHVPMDIYEKAHGMQLDGLVAGVKAYGRNSVHSAFSLTVKVKDEDGNIKYKAYPSCIIKSGLTKKTENGAEEVAEIELEISVMPDEEGNAIYESLATALTEPLATTWMTAFTPALVQVSA